MYQISKSQLNEWFNTPSQLLSWSDIASKMADAFGIEVSEDDCKGVFRANGFNLQQRPMKARLSDLVTVTDDSVQEATGIVTEVVNEPQVENGLYA